MLREVIIGSLVQEIRAVADHVESMRKPRRYPKLTIVVFSQFHPHPLSKGGRGAAQIDCDIEYRPAHHRHQFALGVADLVVQPAQYASGRTAMIILHEIHVKSGCGPKAFRLKLSRKNPLLSPNTRGSMMRTSAMAVGMTLM